MPSPRQLTPRRVAVARCAALAVALLLVPPVGASGHRDTSVIPLGSFRLAPAAQQMRVARPFDRFGVIDAPIVFVALFDARRPLRTPCEMRITVAGRSYPSWKIRQAGQMYVIGLDALARDGTADGRYLVLRIEVTHSAPRLALMASGSPDLRLAGDAALGPLEEVVRKLPRSAAREYLTATVSAAAGNLKGAKRNLARLARSTDEAVAGYARSALRRIRFAEAEARMKFDFATHYRFGLYAQQCGLFRAARLHFEAAVRADERDPDAWFRLGEMMERCGDPIEDVAAVMERAGRAARATASVWDVMVVLLRSERYFDVQDGREVARRAEMSPAQVEKIKRQWRWTEQMIYGAARGRLKLNTRFVELADETRVPYTAAPCGVFGPGDGLIPLRGRYDAVISFRPRGQAQTVGADCGPDGAGLSDLGAWAEWDLYLREWTRQLEWAARTAELDLGVPIAEQSDGCGHQPIPSLGYGLRAALHYYVPPVLLQRVQVCDPPAGAGGIRAWFVSDPAEVVRDEAGHGNRLQAFGPNQVQGLPRRLVVAPAEFVDLKRVFADANVSLPARAVTAAAAFVWSPRRQTVRLWLGYNDGMAVWINGRLIHRGDYYGVNKFADRNLTDTVAKSAGLRRGWNRIDCAIEAWPAPFDRGYGFSVRMCTFDNRPLEGVRSAQRERDVPAIVAPDTFVPRVGEFYQWDAVRADIHAALPLLTSQSLRRYADLPAEFEARGGVTGAQGCVALGSPQDRGGVTRGGVALRAPPQDWNGDGSRDRRLNNLLDWSRESVAVYPFVKRGERRHLLVMRPEAVEAFLTCLREAPRAAQVFGTAPVRNRVLGYLRVGTGDRARDLIVAETLLPTPLPIDEDDLLSP